MKLLVSVQRLLATDATLPTVCAFRLEWLPGLAAGIRPKVRGCIGDQRLGKCLCQLDQ
jgi:hypothetical protein